MGIVLNDGTIKIFLNAVSDMDDTSKELRAFLDYVAEKESDDAFVRKLEEAVKQARKNREWRQICRIQYINKCISYSSYK